MATRKPDPVEYRLSWQSPTDRLYDVEIRFRAKQPETELRLPAWRPGRYLLQNYAANIRQWSATDARRHPLAIRKSGKSSWTVSAKRGEMVVVRYRFFAGILDAGSSYLDPSEAYFNGSNLFMMVEGQRNAPAILRVAAPPKWKVATQLKQAADGSFRARDYDYLIDSPTVFSPTLRTHSFTVEGTKITLAFQNAEGIDTKQFVEPAKEIVKAQSKLFGGIPTDHYTFVYHVWSTWHGVEHEDSCSIILKRSEMLGAKPGDEAYDHFLSITSHEFFHLWNVKRILPQVFKPYDYSVETPTKLLWVMEGITSYYGERTLRDSKLWSRERYLKFWGETIAELENAPGQKFLSVAQASWDGWLQDPAQMHDKANAWISFYTKGEIVGCMLDLEMRRRTNGRVTLDDLMRYLWKNYGQRGRGLEEDAIENATAKLTRSDMSDFFVKYVDGTEPLPYEELFGAAGIEFREVAKDAGKPSLGAKFRTNGGRLFVESVRSGSAGTVAGLMANDELIAVNGTRVADEAAVNKVMASVAAGSKLPLLVSRNDTVMNLEAIATPDDRVEVKLALAEDRDRHEEKLLAAWLGED